MAAPAIAQDLAARLRAGDPVDARGAWLVDADLSGCDLTGVDLSGADLSRADLSGATLMLANLEGAVLFEASLVEAELTGACLRGAHLRGCDASRAGFGRADLSGAELDGAVLDGASLTEARCLAMTAVATSFQGARLRGADLEEADLSRADLRGVDLEDAAVKGALFRRADLREARLRGVREYTHADWVGADTRHADFNGAYLLRREVIDQNYLDEFKNQSRGNAVLHAVWKATSDCGRSVSRWAAWTALIAVIWAGIYSQLPIAYGDNETFLSPLYFSVVTLTTLGYGDALPTTVGGQIAVMCQVVLGYFMLGGLLSIFATKMGSRGE